MFKKKFLKIPKPPVQGEKKTHKRKIRRTWKINPVEKVKESKKRNIKDDDWKKEVEDYI